MGNPHRSYVVRRTMTLIHLHTYTHTTNKHLLNALPVCSVCGWSHVTSTSGGVYLWVCVYLYMWASEPLTSESFGLLQCKGETLTHTHPGGIGPWVEERNPLTQTETESLSSPHPPPPTQSTIKQYIWCILSFPLIRLSCCCCCCYLQAAVHG